jgi:YaiO family outer membrane protein
VRNVTIIMALFLAAGSAWAETPVDADAWVKRGFTHLQKNSLTEAEADFKGALDLTPCNVDAAYGLSLVHKRNGKWKEAEAILEKAEESCRGDEKALRYLSQINPSHEIYVNAVYDWVQKQSDWTQMDLTYVHHFRPDLSAGVTFSDYKRNGVHDEQLGLSLNKRIDARWSFEYLGYYSHDPDFLAEQKHQPLLTYVFPSATVVGAGARFDEYSHDWAKVGVLKVTQYVRSVYGEYTLLTGRDNFGEPVTTNIGKIGYERENKFTAAAGYSYGDETIDQGGGATFPGQKVETIFLQLRTYIRPTWGFLLAGGPEYRDHELFRTTGAASVFAKF